jgi:hypothetical protein
MNSNFDGTIVNIFTTGLGLVADSGVIRDLITAFSYVGTDVRVILTEMYKIESNRDDLMKEMNMLACCFYFHGNNIAKWEKKLSPNAYTVISAVITKYSVKAKAAGSLTLTPARAALMRPGLILLLSRDSPVKQVVISEVGMSFGVMIKDDEYEDIYRTNASYCMFDESDLNLEKPGKLLRATCLYQSCLSLVFKSGGNSVKFSREAIKPELIKAKNYMMLSLKSAYPGATARGELKAKFYSDRHVTNTIESMFQLYNSLII